MRTLGIVLGAFAFLNACAGTELGQPETAPEAGKVLPRQTLRVGSRCAAGPGCELMFDRVIRVTPDAAAGTPQADFVFLFCRMTAPASVDIEPERVIRDDDRRPAGSWEGGALRRSATSSPSVILTCSLASAVARRAARDFRLLAEAKFRTDAGEIIVPVTFRFGVLDCEGRGAREGAPLGGAWRAEGWSSLWSTVYDVSLREEGAAFTGSLTAAKTGADHGTVTGTADQSVLRGTVRYADGTERRFFGAWTGPNAAVGLWSDRTPQGAEDKFHGERLWYLERR